MVVGQILPQCAPTTAAAQLASDSRAAGRSYFPRSSRQSTGRASGTHVCTPFHQCHPAVLRFSRVQSLEILRVRGDRKPPCSEKYRKHGGFYTFSRQTRRGLRDFACLRSRNERILVRTDFELSGLPEAQWPGIIDETFSFHNDGKELADFGMLNQDILTICQSQPTIGKAIETVALHLAPGDDVHLQDLSE